MQNRLLSTTIGVLNRKIAGQHVFMAREEEEKGLVASASPKCHRSRLHYTFRTCNVVRTNAITTLLVPELAELFASPLSSLRHVTFLSAPLFFSERDKVESYIHARIPCKFDKLDKCMEYWHRVDHMALVEILLDTCERMVKVSREIDSLKF